MSDMKLWGKVAKEVNERMQKREAITPDNPLGIDRTAEQAEHNKKQAWMAKERQAIVGWLRHHGGAGNEIAKLIEDGQHWKETP